jgi:hypothetical protein
VRARLELVLAGLEGAGALERGPLSCGDRLGAPGGGAFLHGLARPSALEPALELRELALARGDRLGALAQRLLQALELGARPVVVGAPRLGELPREP